MTNFISLANGKLDNPVMQEWAIRFYDNLPDNLLAEKNQIETEWFHELFIAQLIDREEISLLSRLFRILPAHKFSNLNNLIINNWSTWPATVVNNAAKILAVNAPHELLRLFQDDLVKLNEGGEVDPAKLLALDELLNAKDTQEIKELANQFLALAVNWKDDFAKSQIFYALFKVSKSLSSANRLILLDSGLTSKSFEHPYHSLFLALFTGLFGKNDYLQMIFDNEAYDSPLKLSGLQPLFVDSTPLKEFDSWLNTLPPADNLLTLLTKLAETSDACRILLDLIKNSKQFAAKLSVKTQAQLILAACIHSFAKTTLDASDFELATLVDLLAVDMFQSRWIAELIEQLKRFDRTSIVSALSTRLVEEYATFGAVHLCEAMGELNYPEFIDVLITGMGEDKGDFLCESAQNALRKMGRAAQVSIIEKWDHLDRSQQIYGLSVLRSIPDKVITDFAVTRFQKLMSQDLETACELILASPDERLLELLKPELRRKQILIDRTFYITGRLMNYAGPEMISTEERSIAEYQRIKQIMISMGDGFFPEDDTLSLELECPNCKSVNRYEVKGVIVGDPGDHYLLADEFPCVSCEAEVEFTFTAMAMMAVTAELIKMMGDVEPANTKIRAINCRLDNQVLPLPKAMATVRKRLANNPSDAKQWLCLGNLFSHMNRPKATLDAYRKAVEHMPTAIDAKYNLAYTLMEGQQEVEALQILQDALNHKSSWIFLADFSNFSHGFSELFNHLRRLLKRTDIPALHPSALEAPKKPGRNDPCPCGSGKKFKKCCG